MKKLLKENYLFIISIVFLLGILIFQTYQYIQSVKQLEKEQLQSERLCASVSKSDERYIEYCNLSEQNKGLKLDFYTVFVTTLIQGFSGIVFVLFLFVAIPALSYACKFFKNQLLKTQLQRLSYKQVKKQIFFQTYKAVLILPIVIGIAILFCIFYTRNFNSEYAIFHSSVPWSLNTMQSPILFIFIYLLRIILYSILYVNICLCVVRKYHHYFIAVILSFLLFIGIEAFLEIGINTIFFGAIMKSDFGYLFNIISILSFPDSYGMFYNLIIPFVLVVLSGIVIHFLYQNPENLFIDCERNE